MPSPTNLRFSVAVHVLTYLASQDGATVSSEQLARSTQVNPVHVRRVLGPLRAAGLVCSRPGAGGGWTLGRPAREVTLASLWQVVVGDTALIGQHRPSEQCVIGLGVRDELSTIDDRARAAFLAELDRTTVADLVTPAMVRAVHITIESAQPGAEAPDATLTRQARSST